MDESVFKSKHPHIHLAKNHWHIDKYTNPTIINSFCQTLVPEFLHGERGYSHYHPAAYITDCAKKSKHK